MKYLKYFESNEIDRGTSFTATIEDKMALEVLDIFQDVVDEFGIEEFVKPPGSGFFNRHIYPNNSITWCHWMSRMPPFTLGVMNKSLRMKITFKGDKKERYGEVEKYIKDNFLTRCQNIGVDIDFGGLQIGDMDDPDTIIDLTMNITEKN